MHHARWLQLRSITPKSKKRCLRWRMPVTSFTTTSTGSKSTWQLTIAHWRQSWRKQLPRHLPDSSGWCWSYSDTRSMWRMCQARVYSCLTHCREPVAMSCHQELRKRQQRTWRWWFTRWLPICQQALLGWRRSDMQQRQIPVYRCLPRQSRQAGHTTDGQPLQKSDSTGESEMKWWQLMVFCFWETDWSSPARCDQTCYNAYTKAT